MNKQKATIAGAVLLLFIVLIVYLFSGTDYKEESKQKPKFVSDEWSTEFILESKDPMGIYLFKTMFDSYGDSNIVIDDSLNYLSKDSNSTFIFVGDRFSVYPEEFDTILSEVKKGSNLLLSFHDLIDTINQHFFYDSYNEWYFDEEVKVHTLKDEYTLRAIFQADTVARVWKIFKEYNIKDTNFMTISSFMETPNFVKLKFGKGHIFLHSNPEMFYNYQMLTKDGFNYAQSVIHQFPPKKRVIWLELGRLSDDIGDFSTEDADGDQGRKDNSLLQFLFKKLELLIALLLTILGVILYLIFRSKRYWPIVPYIPENKNRSLDFANTMTAIYLQQESPYSILIVMRRNFRANINRQFFIDLSKQDKAKEIKALSEKSGVKFTDVENLVNMLENQKMHAVTYEYVQEVAKMQRTFYLKTGIIKDKIKQKTEKKKIVFRRQMILSTTFIFLGINAILRGFYLLASSNGTGILFWPIGFLVLTMGIILFSRNLLVVEHGKMIFYPYFFNKKEFEINDLIGVQVSNGNTMFEFTGNRKLTINHLEISRYSKKDFEQFIAPFLKMN
jgi:hypothetical protein